MDQEWLDRKPGCGGIIDIFVFNMMHTKRKTTQ